MFNFKSYLLPFLEFSFVKLNERGRVSAPTKKIKLKDQRTKRPTLIKRIRSNTMNFMKVQIHWMYELEEEQKLLLDLWIQIKMDQNKERNLITNNELKVVLWTEREKNWSRLWTIFTTESFLVYDLSYRVLFKPRSHFKVPVCTNASWWLKSEKL